MLLKGDNVGILPELLPKLTLEDAVDMLNDFMNNRGIL